MLNKDSNSIANLQTRADEIRERHRFQQASKKLLELLASVPGLQFLEFLNANDAIIQTSLAWNIVASYENQPASAISINSSKLEISEWLIESISQLNIIDTCYISIGEIGNLPWAKVHLDNARESFLYLWYQLQSHELIILDSNQKSFWGFIDEEYFYEIIYYSTTQLIDTNKWHR